MSEASAPRMIAVVAMASNRVIGREGGLPWHLPEDLKFFKRTTSGGAILMGRKTWDSIGRPLPKRRNIVLSCSMKIAPEGAELIHHPDEIPSLNIETNLFIIGGAIIYDHFLPLVDEVLLSYVPEPHEGDTFLPSFEEGFAKPEVIEEFSNFEVRRYQRPES